MTDHFSVSRKGVHQLRLILHRNQEELVFWQAHPEKGADRLARRSDLVAHAVARVENDPN